MKSKNQIVEDMGHELVCRYLNERGYELRLQCWRAKDENQKLIYGLGEVDLFLVHPSKNLGLVVEVKSRRTEDSDLPLIFEKQLLRLRRSRAYLQRLNPELRVELGLAWVKVPQGQLEFLWNP